MRPDAILALAFLGGCATPLADEAARSAARSAVDPILAERFPGIPLAPATNCIIDNASAGEILGLAASARGGPTAEAARLILEVATRPDTIQCLAADGLPALLTTL